MATARSDRLSASRPCPWSDFSNARAFLIDPAGKVIRFYGDVDPTQHVDEVIADLQKAEKKPGA